MWGGGQFRSRTFVVGTLALAVLIIAVFVWRISLPSQTTNPPNAVVGVPSELSPADAPTQVSNASQHAQLNSMLIAAVLAMSLATATAVASTFYLYRWRRILSADIRFAVPEALIGSLRDFGKELHSLRSRVADARGNRQVLGGITWKQSAV
jgi:hypothetical protein